MAGTTAFEPFPHTVSARSVATLDIPRSESGVVVGSGRDGRPVCLRLFGPRPTTTAVIADVGLAGVLAARAGATGATLVMPAGRPGGWAGLRRYAEEVESSVRVVGATDPSAAVASFTRPVLSLRHAGGSPPAAAGPWRSNLLLLPDATPVALAEARAADVVVLGRIRHDEAVVVGPFLRLADDITGLLTTLPQDVLAVVADGRFHLVRCQFTRPELLLRLASHQG
jgi:hypothetical protein